MPRAVVLVNTDVGTEEEVMKRLLEFPEVKEVHLVYGVYDLVVFIEAPSHDELRNVIVTKVRRLPHIKSTTTMIIIESSERK